MTGESEELEKKRLYCNSCKQVTNHECKGHYKGVFGTPETLHEELTYRLWICMGCEIGVLEQAYWNDFMDEDEFEYGYFPERSQDALIAKSYSKLKPKLAEIYKEAITCYNGKALTLCAAGLRALLEGICQDQKIKGKNLRTKIDGLQQFLPNKNIIRNLHQFRFMGNEAVHELSAPKAREIALALGVIEDLLNFFYELDYKSSQLREIRRKQKPRIAKSTSAGPAMTETVFPPE